MKEVEVKKSEIHDGGVSKLTAKSVNSGNPKFHGLDERKTFFREYTSKSRKLKIQTMEKELKSVFL